MRLMIELPERPPEQQDAFNMAWSAFRMQCTRAAPRFNLTIEEKEEFDPTPWVKPGGGVAVSFLLPC